MKSARPTNFPQTIRLSDAEKNELKRFASHCWRDPENYYGRTIDELLKAELWTIAQYDVVMASYRQWLNFGLD